MRKLGKPIKLRPSPKTCSGFGLSTGSRPMKPIRFAVLYPFGQRIARAMREAGIP
jgi:hypothetical protein